jgi:hypothetical protein
VSQHLHDGTIPQNAPQLPTALNSTSFDPSTSQAAPDRTCEPALGAYRSNDQGKRIASSSSQIQIPKVMLKKRPTNPLVTHLNAKAIKFVSSNIPSASTRSTQKSSTLQVDNTLVDKVRGAAASRMFSLLFQNSLYPETDDIDDFADAALDHAIAENNDKGTHSSSPHPLHDSQRI